MTGDFIYNIYWQGAGAILFVLALVTAVYCLIKTEEEPEIEEQKTYEVRIARAPK